MATRKRRRTPDPKTPSPSEAGDGPSFRKPPLDEVVCGIRFEPLANFKLPHTGLIWQEFRPEFETIEHAAPLVSGPMMSIDTATGAPLPRLWFSNATGDGLIQFQVDHLYYNWRRREADYPRFHNIFPRFEEIKAKIEALLSKLGEGPLIPVEHELTYINHIRQGEGWETLRDLAQVLPMLRGMSDAFKFLPDPKNVALNMRFDLPSDRGRLDIKLTQGTRRVDKSPTLVLQLTAKGKAAGPAWDSSREWFQLAHRWITNGFVDVTGSTLQQQVWEREDG